MNLMAALRASGISFVTCTPILRSGLLHVGPSGPITFPLFFPTVNCWAIIILPLC